MSSLYNSNTKPLNAGNSFIGLYEYLDSKWDHISVVSKTDKSGVVYVDWSANGKDDLYTHENVYTANSGFIRAYNKKAPYYRVRFLNNSGENQTIFNIHTMVSDNALDEKTYDIIDTLNIIKSDLHNLANETVNILQYERSYANLDTDKLILGADSNPAFKKHQNLKGWNYTNSVAGGASNLYFYGKTTQQRQATHLISDVKNSYVIVKILNLSATNTLPFLVVYSAPTGAGDYQPWYKSKWIYQIPNTEKLEIGMEFMLYFGSEPNSELHPSIRRVKASNITTYGTAQQQNETLLFLTINTDNGAIQDTVNVIYTYAGYETDIIHDLELGNGGQNTVEINNFPEKQIIEGSVTIDNQISGYASFTEQEKQTSNLAGIKSQADKLTFSGNDLLVNVSNPISGFALENTLSGVKTQTDKLQFTTGTNYLKTSVIEMPAISIDAVNIYGWCDHDQAWEKIQIDPSSHSKLLVKEEDVLLQLQKNQYTTGTSLLKTHYQKERINDIIYNGTTILANSYTTPLFNCSSYGKAYISIQHLNTNNKEPVHIFGSNYEYLGTITMSQLNATSSVFGGGMFDLSVVSQIRILNPSLSEEMTTATIRINGVKF